MSNLSNLAAGLVDPMVTHYKECFENTQKILIAVEKAYEELRIDREALRRQYNALEEWATAQEARATVLYDLVDTMLDHVSRPVARDLLPEFEAVARRHNVELSDYVDYHDDLHMIDEWLEEMQQDRDLWG